MFKEIFLFELKMGFKKPATYIFFGVLFLLTLLLGLAVTGAFATSRSDSNTILNSATSITSILLGTSSNLFGLMVNVLIISIMATAVQKDYQYNTHPLFFTKPITKASYFFGRFCAVLLIAILVFSGLVLGYYFGTLYGIGTSYVGEFKLINFLQPFLLFTLPNVFLLGVIFFSLTTFLRNTMMAYIVAIVLMVLQIATNTIGSDIENKMLVALLEPSGSRAFGLIIEYWSPAERNTNLVPLTGALLYNRLIWIGIALFITAISYYGFSFSQFLQPKQWFKRKYRADVAQPIGVNSLSELPKVTQLFSIKSALQQSWFLGLFEFKKLSKSLFYIIMCVLGIATMLLSVKFMDAMYDSPTYMVTYKVIEEAVASIDLFAIIFVIFYSGTIIWRDRETKMVELVGATPVSNPVLFFSKLTGLVLAVTLLTLIACVCGILIQFYYGFYHIDYSQYLVFVVTKLVSSIVFVAFCLCVQVYSPNKFLGFFIALIPIVILPIVFNILQWDIFLFSFNDSGASDPYSDLNGYGGTFIQWPIFRIYWTSIAAFLSLLAILLYARGKEKSIVSRFKLSRYFYVTKYKLYMLSTLLVIVLFGSFIYYEKRVVVDYTPDKEREKKTAEYEKKYKKYASLIQPRIVATIVNVDMFTKTKELHVVGVYTLKNNNSVALDSLYINYIGGKKNSFHFSKLNPSVAYKEVLIDEDYGIKILKLQQPLQPNDSITFEFDVWYKPNSYFEKANSPVVSNGTFINNGNFPGFGYSESAELSENKARKEYNLQAKPRMALITDSAARMNNYISNDGDWIRFETTVSTDEGQTAIAPGYLQKEWVKDGRHYFSYKMDSPILNFYSFLSANYEVKKDKWNDISLEIYYNKGHEYNLDRMMKGMKKALEYYSTNFGPYQHRQVRIIEFPRYQSFAQSFPNTIPFSESIGFITKVDDKDPLSIDVPFYITAHEVSHQWWAHQVIGGNVQGSVLMSETMSQYSALMVMEKEYGKDAMKKFLKYEMDKYLKGRTFESKNEMPMMLVENQQYIHYNKGSVIMYALKDYIGEATLNNAIKAYLNKTKFTGPIYTNAIEFVDYIKKATPDSLQYLVTDMFEKITLYENYVKKLDYKKINDKEYKVTLTMGCAKFYAGSTGNLTKATVNDYVDIGIFSTQKINNKDVDKPLYFTRVKMDAPEKTFEFRVSEMPVSAGIDPYLKLIDRTPNNNSCKFGVTPEKPNLNLSGNDLSIMIGGK
jgi:ABC-2 type transport system permease protein